MKKKTKLRRKSKNPIKKAKDEADTALQNAYRRNYPTEKCESCGNQFYCMHHHLPKSRSNAGRYEHKNLIFICKPCHDEISFNGGSQIVARYTIKRGKEWVNEMDKLEKNRRASFGIKELKKIKQKYELQNINTIQRVDDASGEQSLVPY